MHRYIERLLDKPNDGVITEKSRDNGRLIKLLLHYIILFKY